MKTLITLLLLLSMARPAWALCDDWRTQDTMMLATWNVGTYIDWRQSSETLDRGGKEVNPWVGGHPNRDQFALYFLLRAGAVALASCYLPPEQRTWYLGLELIAKGALITFNYTHR